MYRSAATYRQQFPNTQGQAFVIHLGTSFRVGWQQSYHTRSPAGCRPNPCRHGALASAGLLIRRHLIRTCFGLHSVLQDIAVGKQRDGRCFAAGFNCQYYCCSVFPTLGDDRRRRHTGGAPPIVYPDYCWIGIAEPLASS